MNEGGGEGGLALAKITPLGRNIQEVAAARGFEGLAELADAVNASTGRYYTPKELADWPRPGFVRHLDTVLRLTPAERDLLAGEVVKRVSPRVY